jgi:hypothetical protein
MKILLIGLTLLSVFTVSAHETSGEKSLYQLCLEKSQEAEAFQREIICESIDVKRSIENNIMVKTPEGFSSPLSEVYLPCVMNTVKLGLVLNPPQVSRDEEQSKGSESFDNDYFVIKEDLGCTTPYSKYFD